VHQPTFKSFEEQLKFFFNKFIMSKHKIYIANSNRTAGNEFTNRKCVLIAHSIRNDKLEARLIFLQHLKDLHRKINENHLKAA
jgi:hypothetical protein